MAASDLAPATRWRTHPFRILARPACPRISPTPRRKAANRQRLLHRRRMRPRSRRENPHQDLRLPAAVHVRRLRRSQAWPIHDFDHNTRRMILREPDIQPPGRQQRVRPAIRLTHNPRHAHHPALLPQEPQQARQEIPGDGQTLKQSDRYHLPRPATPQSRSMPANRGGHSPSGSGRVLTCQPGPMDHGPSPQRIPDGPILRWRPGETSMQARPTSAKFRYNPVASPSRRATGAQLPRKSHRALA